MLTLYAVVLLLLGAGVVSFAFHAHVAYEVRKLAGLLQKHADAEFLRAEKFLNLARNKADLELGQVKKVG